MIAVKGPRSENPAALRQQSKLWLRCRGENNRKWAWGTTVFKDLVANPPTDETEFRDHWKLCFLTLIANHFREYGVSAAPAKKVISLLEESQLLPRDLSETPLRKLLRLVRDYVRRATEAESVEGGLNVDPTTGMTGVSGKTTFRESAAPGQDRDAMLTDEVLELADTALEESDINLWLVLDRLDVAFAEDEKRERNALRALFRVYLDLQSLDHISLKTFPRNDPAKTHNARQNMGCRGNQSGGDRNKIHRSRFLRTERK